MKKKVQRVVGIDLFCGAGGLTCGLQNEGIKVIAGYDIDPVAEYAFKTNNKSDFVKTDVRKVSGEDLLQRYSQHVGALTLLAGCAPCQPFSSYTNPIKSRDDKWGLLGQFSRLIKEASPDLVTMENVPNLEKQDIFKSFLNSLKRHGYHYSYQIVSCPEYGIPQSRKRLVLLASKLGPIDLIEPTHEKSSFVTVRESIAQLEKLKAGEQDPKDPLHVCSKLSPINMQRIKHSKPGGSWRDWPKHLVAKCHAKGSGKSYPSVYGRMSWDKPSPTMTTQCYGFGNGRFGHPEQNRAISLREAAILQTFPAQYQFVPKGTAINMRSIGTLIGNAVPVRLGEIVAKSIKAHLECVG